MAGAAPLFTGTASGVRTFTFFLCLKVSPPVLWKDSRTYKCPCVLVKEKKKSEFPSTFLSKSPSVRVCVCVVFVEEHKAVNIQDQDPEDQAKFFKTFSTLR